MNWASPCALKPSLTCERLRGPWDGPKSRFKAACFEFPQEHAQRAQAEVEASAPADIGNGLDQ